MLKIIKYLTFITSIEALKEEFNWHDHIITARVCLNLTKVKALKY
jgi:hypothetical protein